MKPENRDPEFEGAEEGASRSSGRSYSSPQLTVYGDIRELTLATASQNERGDNPMFPRLKT